HDVYLAAREVIDTKIPTLSLESARKYQWHPDRMPRLAGVVAGFAPGGGKSARWGGVRFGALGALGTAAKGGCAGGCERLQAEACPTGMASRMAMFRVYYLGGAEYHAARRHLGISE